MSKTDSYTFALNGDAHVVVSVVQPPGGRYVFNIKIESANHRLLITDVHYDVAETLRDGLDAFLTSED